VGWGLVVRAFRALAFLVVFSWAGSASSEDSLYQTLPPRPQSSFGKNTSFVFIAPYITRAETTLSASISKTTTAGNSGTSGSQAGKASTPTVSYADYVNGQIRYWVGCDLRSVLHEGDQVIVTGVSPAAYNTAIPGKPLPAPAAAPLPRPVPATVVGVKAGQITVTAPASWDPPAAADVYKSGGMITGANLDVCPLTGDAFTIALTITATPLSRGYLYLHRNAFYDDSVDFSVGSDGMLSNSDTSSTQEITAILTELAETAGAIVGGGPALLDAKLKADLLPDHDKDTIDQLKKDTPQQAADFLNKLPAVDLTRLLEELPPDDLAVVLKKLPRTDLGLLLKKLAPADLAIVVRQLSSVDAFGVLSNLSQADLGEILKKWPPADLTALAKHLTLRKLNEILQELTQTDEKTVIAAFSTIFATINDQTAQEETKKLESQKRPVCFKAVADIVKTVPLYDTIAFDEVGGTVDGSEGAKLEFSLGKWPYRVIPKEVTPKDSTVTWTIPIVTADDQNRDGVSIRFALKTRFNSYSQAAKPDKEALSFGGFVAFFPVPATAKSECVVTRTIDQLLPTTAATITSQFFLSPPTVVNLYTESHFLNPQRDFLTNPHDTFTFTAGLITGHKFTGQSAAKTLVDTITAPIRSLMPSVSVTQSVAVSPTGKTTTTSTQTGPPKGP
jgi:hypothetical protein